MLLAAFGVALFSLPFLRSPDGPDDLGPDVTRAEDDIPFDEDLALVEEELELELAEAVATASETWFGLDSPGFRDAGLVDVRRVAPGRASYQVQCLGCHGVNGDGGGPAARYLSPRPRNFRRGVFKFTSTPTGRRPLRSDLFRTITSGLAGSAMPDFRLLPEEKRLDLVEYVRYLSMRGEFEQLMLEVAYEDEEIPDAAELAEIVRSRWSDDNLIAVFPDAPETPRDSASVERGRVLFVDAGLTNCAACHGESGRGDGPNADAYHDDWGYPIRPRDFTPGVFRAGSKPEDLYRTIATGINGTPMGSFSGNLEGEQIWDLVHYVQSLSRPAGEGSGR